MRNMRHLQVDRRRRQDVDNLVEEVVVLVALRQVTPVVHTTCQVGVGVARDAGRVGVGGHTTRVLIEVDVVGIDLVGEYEEVETAKEVLGDCHRGTVGVALPGSETLQIDDICQMSTLVIGVVEAHVGIRHNVDVVYPGGSLRGAALAVVLHRPGDGHRLVGYRC